MDLMPMIKTGRKGSRDMKVVQTKGFTLVELMISLTIVSIMMLFAIPAFNDFTNQRRMASNVNSLISAINLARSEAGRRGNVVTVQTLDASDSDDEWGPGFCITDNDPGDCDAAIQAFALEGNFTFDATDDFDGVDSISYLARGLQQDAFTGTFRLCGDDGEDDPGRVISVNAIGRPSVRDLVCFP